MLFLTPNVLRDTTQFIRFVFSSECSKGIACTGVPFNDLTKEVVSFNPVLLSKTSDEIPYSLVYTSINGLQKSLIGKLKSEGISIEFFR